jgi:predicted CXXCH cytochrome family protein
MELKLLTENALFVAIFVIGFLPVISVVLFRAGKSIRIVAIASAALVVLAVIQRPIQDGVLAATLPTPTNHDGMQPSSTCISCHPGQYKAWYASFHRTMTQKVGPDTVVAPFDGRRLEWQGRAFVVDRREQEFWVTEVKVGDAQAVGELEEPKRVVMSTGSRHQQIYWTPAEDGSLKQFPWVYEIAMARWIPSEHTFLRPEGWTQQQPTWNVHCIRCHSVGALPNFDAEQNEWNTEVTELGIACAGCHGAGEEHIRVHQNPLHRHLKRILDLPDPTIVNPKRLAKERSAEVCGQCHAYATLPGGFYEGSWPYFRSGKKLEHHFTVSDTTARDAEHMFWPDGSARTGGREYNSMLLSGCFTNGEMTCVSCHSLHGSEPLDLIEPAMNGDKACLQCHSEFSGNIARHTFHEPESSGSRCLNCHMPYTTYGLLSTARSHRVDSPATTGQTTQDRPNACNLCHLDKTLAWTAEQLSNRYGTPSIPLADEHNNIAASILWALRGDAAQRAIVAWHMGQPWALEVSGKNWVEPYLSRLLVDPYSVVRLIAHRSLTQLGGENIPFDYLGNEQEREQVMQTYLDRWQQNTESLDQVLPPATLLEGPGRVRWDVVENIYQQRDNRRLFISE